MKIKVKIEWKMPFIAFERNGFVCGSKRVLSTSKEILV
jgi:hypothetical protein